MSRLLLQLRSSSSISRQVLRFAEMILGGTDTARSNAYLQALAKGGSRHDDCKTCPGNFVILIAEQKKSVAAASRARDEYVGRVLHAMKSAAMNDEQKPPASWPVPGANNAAAALLRKECKGKADPAVLDAVCSILEDSRLLGRVCSPEEVAALQAVLNCQCHKLVAKEAIKETSKNGLKLAELFRFIDGYVSPFVLCHEALRNGDEKAHMAARKTVAPLFGVTRHPKYFLADAVDIKQQQFCLGEKPRQMLERFVMMRMATAKNKCQAADEILEQGVALLKRGKGAGDSPAQWDKSNAQIETKHLNDDAFFGATHLDYMQQLGKQRVPRSIEHDIQNVAVGVREMTVARGAPCTLGGIPLLEDAKNLTQEVNSRVKTLEKHVAKNEASLFSRRGPALSPVEIVDRVAVAQHYRQRDRRNEFEVSDDENEVPRRVWLD